MLSPHILMTGQHVSDMAWRIGPIGRMRTLQGFHLLQDACSPMQAMHRRHVRTPANLLGRTWLLSKCSACSKDQDSITYLKESLVRLLCLLQMED